MKTVSDPSRIGVGVVGCGRVAMTRHLPVLDRLDGVRILAVADPDPHRRSEAADRYQVPRATADVQEILDVPQLDVVAVCVPPAQHAEVVVAALRAGKHVFVEKPLALDLDECDRMVNEVKASGLRAAVGHSLRWHPHVRKLKADVDRGALGVIRMVATTFCGRADYAGPVPEWRKHPDLGGNTFFETGVHHLDLWRFLTGREVEEVSATATRSGAWDEESSVVTGRLDGGVLAVTALAQGTTNTNQIEVIGDAACARSNPYRSDGLDRWSSSEYQGGLRNRAWRGLGLLAAAPATVTGLRTGGVWMESFRAEWEDFLSAVREDRATKCPLHEGREAVRIVLAAIDSAIRGRPVPVVDAPRNRTVAGG
ncbi:MAG: Gfo/Idh/MocA family protein [Gemmatimonadota bacterium]